MKNNPVSPVLVAFYRHYLEDEDTAGFLAGVSQRYTVATLERLAEHGGRISRRAAVMALGFLGDYATSSVLGRALTDNDRGVRMIADHSIREMWCRDGNPAQQQRLRHIMRLTTAGRYEAAVTVADRLIRDIPSFAEAWHQRAVAMFHLAWYQAAASDFQQALEINPYHFLAAASLGHCFLELDEREAALESFGHALRLNPGLERVRSQVAHLRRTL